MSIPYVYFIQNKTTGMKYIGCKYSKYADPDLFWISYFTCSKHVHALIEKFGKEDFKTKILRTFSNEYDALLYEGNLLRYAVFRQDYLNLHSTFVSHNNREQYFFTKEKQRKIASFYGKLSYQEKTGIHSLTVEERMKASSLGGKASAAVCLETKRGIFSDEARRKAHETLRREQKSAYYDPVLKKSICSKGGKQGPFSEYWYEKNNIPNEERIEAQRRRGKKGGPKNKGGIFYNDGVNEFRYTAKQQKDKDFNEFISETKFSIGRITQSTRGKIWVNDGIKNYMLPIDKINWEYHTKGRFGDRSKYNGQKNKYNKGAANYENQSNQKNR